MPHEPLILPIGHDLGGRSAGPGPAGRRQQVRVGTELMELSDHEYVVWLLAHTLDDGPRPTREFLIDQTGRFGLVPAAAATIVERFLDDGLLAELVPGQDSAIAFARNHQLVPLLLGLGPDPDHERMLLIGLVDQPLIQVSAALYDVWTWAHLSSQLWAACADAADVARRQGVTNPAELEPDQVLTGVLEAVHDLLRVRAAYLDRRTAA